MSEKIVIVYKKSVYEQYHASPDAELRRFMERDSAQVQRMRRSHEAQRRTLDAVVRESARQGQTIVIHRAELEKQPELLARAELAVSVGGDGTFLEVSHYVKEATLLGVNSDPESSRGFFCVATEKTFSGALANLEAYPRTRVYRIEVRKDGVLLPEPVLNDVLIAHPTPAATTRYELEVAGVQQTYKNSGLLACTAAGSTGWMYEEGGSVMPLDSRQLQYVSRGARGERPAYDEKITVRSSIREGKLFIDGEHLQYDFTLGTVIELQSGAPLDILGDLEQRRVMLTL